MKHRRFPVLLVAGAIVMGYAGAGNWAGAAGAAPLSADSAFVRARVGVDGHNNQHSGGAGSWAFILLATALIFRRPAWKRLL